MNWKELVFKTVKGAITGASASLTTLSLLNVPRAIFGVALSGAMHGISNAMEQMKDKAP